MRKIIIILYVLSLKVFSITAIDEALLIQCQKQGHVVFHSCIEIPPTSPEQAVYCATLYSNYNSCLGALNSPLSMVISKSASPYAWSPYDICKFQTSYLAVYDLCPSTKIL